MNYLIKGCEPRKKIELLLSLTKIEGNIAGGLIDYFTRSLSVTDCAALNDCLQSNLSVRIKELNQIAKIVEDINELK